ncbi:MAG TPA: family 16 glycoside hydrolase [Planctomycetota bacterium]
MLLPWLVLLAPSVAAPPFQQTGGFDEALYDVLEYRSIGPFRGGRSAAVTGVPSEPSTWYMGAAGGGVWRSEDDGRTWANLSDGFFGGSIGAVAVSEWDPNVIYAGGGEVTVRGNVSHGTGIWKSVDRGKTWVHAGLADSHHVPRIRIHPRDPELVYAAVLGHLYGPSEARGVYRSRNGGASWERILTAGEDAGAVDLVMDPRNPRILFASTWRVRRTPHGLESGGEGSALWKSTDGGDTWTDVSGNEGLPEGTRGIIGVSVSAADPERVFAIVEAEEGGLFRSDDGGETWRRVNQERFLRQRAWYYSRVYTDPQDADRLWVVNVGLWRSKDGGASFERVRTPHGDHHDLWISPADSARMAVADDGGAQVSVDGGDSWSSYHNQPTGQFYRVTTDAHFPYRIYGAQQDNSTVRIAHRSAGRSIGERDWEPTAGGESGWIAPNALDPDLVFGGSYGGSLEMLHHRSGEVRAVNVWPDNPMGHGAEDMEPRFNWNFPILWSRHDPGLLFAGGNRLFQTRDRGQSWEAISPDLTRADPATLGTSGGPITKDNSGAEYYATIFTVAESPHRAGVIWTGSDDGLVHLTRDGGANWSQVTPPVKLLPAWAQINSIEADPFEPGGLYLAATRYRSDDFRPFLLRTLDYGKTWQRIDKGIPADHFTRVVRADPLRRGVLYAGTERGMYLSFDDGKNWRPFQLNLPQVPITDLAVRDGDLVVATQGRSFWVLDDLTPLRQMGEELTAGEFGLYAPRPTYRLRGGRAEASPTEGRNPHPGVMIRYFLREDLGDEELKLEILGPEGAVIEAFTARGEAADDAGEQAEDEDAEEPAALETDAGSHQVVWDMQYPDAEDFKGMILWSGGVDGPRAVPGSYRARLTKGGEVRTVGFEILADPRSAASQADLQAQFDFLLRIRDELSRVHRGVDRIRAVRGQIEALLARMDAAEEHQALRDTGAQLSVALTAIEETLYQTKNRSGQDPLNFPIRLNDKLAGVASNASRGDFAPTAQAQEVLAALQPQLDAAIDELERILTQDLPAFDAQIRASGIPAVSAGPARPAGGTVSLFNGVDLAGWHTDVPDADADPGVAPSFGVRDGLLVTFGSPGGHLITDAVYRDFRLEVEYRWTGEPGNCGVLVHASTPRRLYGMFPQSIEVQMHRGNAGDFWCIGEDIAVEDMVARRGPRERWGVDGDRARRIQNLTDDSERPPGEWNRMVIECRGNAIDVWVNGDLVNQGFACTADHGQIAVQAEGAECEFRKLALTPLPD